MSYLPRYQPLLPAAALPNRRRRCSYPNTTSCSRVFTYYIEGSPVRVINSYSAAKVPSCNKSSKVFLCSSSLGHHLTRVTGSASLYDLSSSHVYTRPESLIDISTRQHDNDSTDICQNICDGSSFGLDMTPSESGVSVGESEDWSVFGREDDNTSQHSSASWSTFCDNDLDKRGLDHCSGTSFHGDGPRGFHHGDNNDDNFRNGNKKEYTPNEDSQNSENTQDRYSLYQDVRKTLDLNTVEYGGKHEDLSCDNGFSEGFYLDYFDSPVSSVLGDTEVTREFGCMDVTKTQSSMEVIRTCSSIEVTREHDNREFTKTHGDVELTTLFGDVKLTKTYGDVGLTKIHGDVKLTKTYGDVELTTLFGDVELTKIHGDVKLTKTYGDVELTKIHGNVELTKTYGDMELTKTYGDMELTNIHGNVELTKTYGDVELTKIHGNVELTKNQGETEATRFYSRPNSLAMSSGDGKNCGVQRQEESKCGTPSDEVCIQSEDRVQEVRGVKGVTDVQVGTDVYNLTDVQVGTDVYNLTKTSGGTNMYSLTKVHGYRDGVRFIDALKSPDVYKVTDEELDCADVCRIPEDVQNCINMYCVREKVLSGTDGSSVRGRVLRGSQVGSMTEEVYVDTQVHSVTNVQDFRVVYSAKDEVQKNICVYSLAEETQDITDVYSGDRVENVKAIDSDKAALHLLSEEVSEDDVNRWDLPGIRNQRCFNTPEGCAIDSPSESTDVRAEQTALQTTSVCHRDSASVDSGINNNTSVEHVIDSSQAAVKCLSCSSEFWEGTQSRETDSGKTGSRESKYTDIDISTDSSQAPPVQQRTARVSQQFNRFNSQIVISFDSCDVSGKLYFCVCCGKCRKAHVGGLVCANCLINLYCSNVTDGEKIINYCCGREDIDWRAGIPVSILDESIKHAREELRRNKDTQHVEHFCAQTQGVGSGKTHEIIRYDRPEQQEGKTHEVIRYDRPEQQEATKSSSTRDSHTADCQRTIDTEAVDTNLISTSRSGADKSSHLVLPHISTTLDTVSRISQTCQVNNGIVLFSGLTTQEAVSIDKTSIDTLSSQAYVPPDFINSTASSDTRLKTDEIHSSIAPVYFTSPALLILPRDSTSVMQRMKENNSNLDTNSSVSSARVLDLKYLVCASGSMHRSRDSASSPVDLFTSGCHGNPLDNLHAQLSAISGNSFSERYQVPEFVATDVYRISAEATCSSQLGHVGDISDAVYFSSAPGGPAIKQAVLDPAAGKQPFTDYSHFNQSPARSDSLELPATKEEYDNDDIYLTAQTQRGSRLLPRSYHQMYLFRYEQAKASSLWTVKEEPENICDETASYSSPTLPREASSIRNSRSDQTMFTFMKPCTSEADTEVVHFSSINNTSSEKCTLGNGSAITAIDHFIVFDTKDNGGTHESASSEQVLNLFLDRDCVSLDVKSNIIKDRTAGDDASVEHDSNKTRACDRFPAGVDKDMVASCSVHGTLVTPTQECGGSFADGFQGMYHKRSAVCEDVPQGSYSGNVSVLDKLSESLSQFGRLGVDSVYDRKSLFREVTADSDTESEECHLSFFTRHIAHMDESGVSDLGCNDSGIISDLDTSTSSDSIKHIHFTSTGKAEFRDTCFDDYDNAVCPRSKSDPVKTQTDLSQIGKPSDTREKSFEKIEEEMNISMSRLQEIAQMMLPQDEFSEKGQLPTPECDELYREFTNEDTEKQQNHGCIVQEDEDVSNYRFKRFLKKSHNKRRKGLKILRFFSRLSCVAETTNSPITSPVTQRKLSNRCDTVLNAELELLQKQTLSDPLLVSCTCHHHKTHSLSSVGNCSSPSTSNQSLDSVPSKTDSAYSSLAESTEAADYNPVNTNTSSSEGHAFTDHVIKGVNMDSSTDSCSSSSDFSSNSLEVNLIQSIPPERANLSTTAPKNGAPTVRNIPSDIFDQLHTCDGEIDTALLTHMRYGHTPAKVDKTWG